MPKSPEHYAINLVMENIGQDDFTRFLWWNRANYEYEALTNEPEIIFASNGGKQKIWECYCNALSGAGVTTSWQRLAFNSGLGESLDEEKVHAIQEEEEAIAWQTTSATIAAVKAAAAHGELSQVAYPEEMLIIKSDVTYHWQDENGEMHVLNKPSVKNKAELYQQLCDRFASNNGKMVLIADTSLAVVEYSPENKNHQDVRMAVIGRTMDFSINLGENYREILALYLFDDEATAHEQLRGTFGESEAYMFDSDAMTQIQGLIALRCADQNWELVDTGNGILDVNGGLKIQHPILFPFIESVNDIRQQDEGFEQARADLIFYMRGGSHELPIFIDYWQQDTQWLGTDDGLSEIVNNLSEIHLGNSATFSIGSVFRVPTNEFAFNRCRTHYSK
jgi:hypothetical protein